MEKKRCNIRDLARAAHLSPGTVSRILNNRPGDMMIPEVTRLRVVELAKEMQYVPNVHAQRLFSKRSGVIGLVVPSLRRNGGPVFGSGHLAEVLAGMEEHLDSSSRRLELIINNQDFIESRSHLSLLQNGSLDGLLIWGAYEDEQFWQELVDAHFPYVFIGGYPRLRSWVNCVTADQAYAAGRMTELILYMGHRQVLILEDPANRSAAWHRRFGISAALDNRQLPSECIRQVRADSAEAVDREIAAALADGFHFTAVVAVDFPLANWTREVLAARNWRIPEDVSCAACEVFPGQAVGWPELTRIENDDRMIGAEAVRAIENIIDARDPFLVNRHLEGSLVCGATVRSLNGNGMDL